MADWGVVGICGAGGAVAAPLLDRAARTVRRPVRAVAAVAAVVAATDAGAPAAATDAGAPAAATDPGAPAAATQADAPAAGTPAGAPPAPSPLVPAQLAAAVVATGGLCALGAARLGAVPALGAYCALFGALVCLSIADLRTGLLPRRFVYPAAALVAVGLLGASAAGSQWRPLLQALVGAAAALAVFGAVWLVFPRGIGFGDVRLAGLCGMALGWLGYRQLYLGFLAGFVLGSVLGLGFFAVTRSRRFPFGPALAAGCCFGVLWGGWLGNLWFGARL